MKAVPYILGLVLMMTPLVGCQDENETTSTNQTSENVDPMGTGTDPAMSRPDTTDPATTGTDPQTTSPPATPSEGAPRTTTSPGAGQAEPDPTDDETGTPAVTEEPAENLPNQ